MTESPPPYPGIEPTAPPQPMNGHPQESAAGQNYYITLSDFVNKYVRNMKSTNINLIDLCIISSSDNVV